MTVGVLVLAIGMLDQASGAYIAPPGLYTAPFESDRDFFLGVEQDLPTGAAVAQFPIRRFPEEPPPGNRPTTTCWPPISRRTISAGVMAG